MLIRPSVLCMMAAIPCLPAAAPAQMYGFVVDASSSAMSASFAGSGTFEGVLIGNYDQFTNPGGTRTLDWDIFGNRPPPPVNIPKDFWGDAESAGGAATSPTGAYELEFDLVAGTVALRGLAVDLLAGAQPSAPVDATISYESFLTATPNYAYPFLFPIPITLGEATLAYLTVTQDGEATGALTPAGPGEYTFTLEVPIVLDGILLLQGSPAGFSTPQVVTVSGSATLSGDAAAAVLSFEIDQSQATTDPITGPQDQPQDFPPPTGSGEPAHLIIDLTITSSETSVSGGVDLPATGVRTCSADFNGDGVLSVADFTAFRAAFLAGDLAADFNGDGVPTVADFTAFRQAFLAGCG